MARRAKASGRKKRTALKPIRLMVAGIDIGAKAYERQFHDRRLFALAQNAQDLGFKLVPVEAGVG